ncbi:integrin beta-1-like isoform X2 [Uloborus diversus]|uniref:integrin beta-1-like isoform X2 n=1 Tax=Uloborus diversus TaxID=327109 RepID=UPI002409A98D|nr:integrin beta-1-like isoform X2 [Uloborus diversus]
MDIIWLKKKVKSNAANVFFLFMLFLVHYSNKGVYCNNCDIKETCGQCIAESPDCAWCWYENFTDTEGPRCDYVENLRKRKCKNIVNPKSSMAYVQNLTLSDKGAKEDEAIQIKPQEINIRLRPKTPMVFNVEFRQAIDYPVDLYYLMDLSNSMSDDKDKLAELGNKLASEMRSITSNFRLGFGSFVDKTVAPFVNSYPTRLKEPCPGCAAPYGYRNNMPLSEKTDEFARKVNAAPVSGNLDAPEGGFDAIMQAIVCKKEVGWRNNSRKVLVFSTDNAFHYAGDGKKISSSVEMTDNTGDNNIQVSYFSKCLGQKEEKTNICGGLKVGTKVTFRVELKYDKCPKDPKRWNRSFQISPVGLQDSLTVNLEMLCQCDCEKKENEEPFSEKCSKGNGSFVCGICKCYKEKYGKECECDANQSDPTLEAKECYKENSTVMCSGNGICRCGQCHCNPRSNPNEKIYGKFCDCNNYSCDKSCSGNGECDCGKCKCNPGWTTSDCSCRDSNDTCISSDKKICSGHGICNCGSCKCDTEYFGAYCDDCSTCPGKCDELRECVECWLRDQKGANLTCFMCGEANVQLVDSLEVKGNEKQCMFEDENNCRFYFKYIFNKEGESTVHIKSVRECPTPVNVIAITSGVAGGVVATGLFLLMIWKILTSIHDRRELAKFEKERLMAKWQKVDNPIYIQPTSEFRNPAYRGD